ncbi:MAG: methyltransferase [Cohnella sp.]|nr:methyltransferase [Cohnella sp.]
MKRGDYSAQQVKEQFAFLTENKPTIIESLVSYMNTKDEYKRKRTDTKKQLAEKTWERALQQLGYAATDIYSIRGYTEADMVKSIGEIVDGLTDEAIQKKLADVQTQRDARKKALENPETLDELRQKKSAKGLSAEEQARLDELEASKAKEDRESARQQQTAPSTTIGAYTVEETKHTKTGETIYVVKRIGRMEGDVFKALREEMAKIGGHWSNFTHGFNFKNDPTEKLAALTGGTVAETPVETQPADETTTANKTAAKLREVADNMQQTIDDKLGDRQTNTARRAAMAASAIKEGDKLKQIQGILRNLANAIESGQAKHLDGITARTHVETLENILIRRVYEKMREDNEKTLDRNGNSIRREPQASDIDGMEYPKPTLWTSTLRRFLDSLTGVPGIGRNRLKVDKYLRQVGKSDTQIDVTPIEDELIELVSAANKHGGKAKDESGWINDNLTTNKRLKAMGIETAEQLRAALREYLKYREGTGTDEADMRTRAVKQRESELARSKIEGFFPTPPAIVQQMLDAAGIEEGMSVLEPSAGKGNIADAIREAQPNASLDVIEINGALRELLQEKGHRVTSEDFMEADGSYDRIIMNPPFERGQDIEHVQRAYGLLAPGGRIVAIMSEGPFFRGDKNAAAFREWLESVGGTSEKLPEGAFKSSERPTGVATRLVVIDKSSKMDDKPVTEKEATPEDATSDIIKLEGVPDIHVVVHKTKDSFNDELAKYPSTNQETLGNKFVMGFLHPRTNTVHLAPEYQEFVKQHEVGHAIYNHIRNQDVEKMKSIVMDQHLEWIEASKVIRPKAWQQYNAMPKGARKDAAKKYLYNPSELFADAHAFFKTNAQAKKIAPKTFAFFSKLYAADQSTYSMASRRRKSTPIIDVSQIAHLSPKVTQEIGDLIARQLGTTIRDITSKASAEGTFSPGTGTGAVRERSYGEWRVVGHELGHAFSLFAGGPIGMDAELSQLVKSLYPRRIPKKLQREEGFAEFFFLWVADPVLAEQVAPKTTKAFEEYIDSDKDLSELFIKVRTIVDNDLAGGAYEKAMGAITSEIDPSAEVYGGEYRVKWWERPVFNHLDYTIPAKDMMHEANKSADMVDLAKLMAVSGDARAKAIQSFVEQPRDHEGRFLEGRTLKSIAEDGINEVAKVIGWKKKRIGGLNEKMGAFEVFGTIMLAKRVKERYGRDFTRLPLTEQEADAVLEQAEKDFPAALDYADEYAETLSALIMDKLERADVITDEIRKRIEAASEHYIPFYYDERKRPATSGSTQQGRTNKNPVKRFTGRSAPVLNFYQATMLKLTEVEQAIEYKRTLDTLQDVLEQPQMGMFGVKIPAPQKVVQVNLEHVAGAIEKLLNDGTDVKSVAEDQAVKIFMAGGFDTLSKSEPIVMNVRDGKPTFMRLSPDVFEMIMAMKPVQIEGFARALALTSRVYRFTALATARYISSAIARDFVAAMIQSKGNPLSLVRHMREATAATMGISKDTYNAYVAAGGHSGAYENVLKNAVTNSFDEGLIKIGGSGWAKAPVGGKKLLVRLLRTPSEALRVIEEGPRIAQFIATWKAEARELGYDGNEMWDKYKQEGTDALPQDLQDNMERILVEAAHASREVTTNFGLHGAKQWSRQYIRTVTFLHGTTQGMYRFGRMAKNNPLRFTSSLLALSGLSAIAWALMNADDDDRKHLQDMSSEMRDRYWWVPIPGTGMYYAVAKPYEYALAANLAERSMDDMWSNMPGARKHMEDWRTAVADSFGAQPINQFLKTWMELAKNENSLGSAIVPEGDQGLAKDLQKGPSTSKTATAMANIINMAARMYEQLAGGEKGDPNAGVSARQVEYFVNGMAASYGKGIMGAIDFATAKLMGDSSHRTAGAEYAPVIGSVLYGQAEGGSRIVSKFYDVYDKAQRLSASANKLMDQQEKTKKAPSKPAFATEDNVKLIRYLPAMRAISNELSDVRKEYNALKDVADPQQRRRLEMQQDYIERLAAGIMFGVTPESPDPSAGITDQQIQMLSDRFTAAAQKKLVNEAKTKGGATEQAAYLLQLMQQHK